MNIVRKIIILILVSLCTGNFIYAQKEKGGGKKTGKGYTVEWGPDIKMKGAMPSDMLLYDKGSFLRCTQR